MLKFLLLFSCALSLFAQSITITPNEAVYSIDVSHRGTALVNMYNSLISVAQRIYPNYTIGLQTTSAFLQPVRSITSTPYNTLLIVNYGVQNQLVNQTTLVVPVEQIVELVFNTTQFSANQTQYTSSVPANTVPYYNVNLTQRAADIISIFGSLNKAPYRQANSQINLQTTVRGNFYTPITDGLIENVANITTGINGSTFLLITYPQFPATPASYIVIEADQVSNIVYIPNIIINKSGL